MIASDLALFDSACLTRSPCVLGEGLSFATPSRVSRASCHHFPKGLRTTSGSKRPIPATLSPTVPLVGASDGTPSGSLH